MNRPEWEPCLAPEHLVVVHPRGCGVTTWLRNLPPPVALRPLHSVHFQDSISAYDWPGGNTSELRSLLFALTRAYTKVARAHYRDWSFKVFVREEDWHAVRKNFTFLNPYFLSQGFSPSFLGVSAADLVGPHLAPKRRPWREFSDARGRVLPGMVSGAVMLSVTYPTLPTAGLLSLACAAWLSEAQNDDIRPMLQAAYVKPTQRRADVQRRLHAAGFKKDAMDFLEAASVGAPMARLRWRWAPAYCHVSNAETKPLHRSHIVVHLQS